MVKVTLRAAVTVLSLVAAAMLAPSTTWGDTDRPEKEAPIREKYNDRVTFGGEYNELQLIPIAVDIYLTGGTVTAQWAKSELQKAGIDAAKLLVQKNYDSAKDDLQAGVMNFTLWKDTVVHIPEDGTVRTRLYTYTKYVPYLGILRRGGADGQPPIVPIPNTPIVLYTFLNDPKGSLWKYLGPPRRFEKLDQNPAIVKVIASGNNLYTFLDDPKGSLWKYLGTPPRQI